jgi:stress-induced morphogen
MISVDELRVLLLSVPAEHVEVKDLTGTSDHFEALVVAKVFEGKSLIERHRLVYATLGERMKADIHALSLTTQTEGEVKT